MLNRNGDRAARRWLECAGPRKFRNRERSKEWRNTENGKSSIDSDLFDKHRTVTHHVEWLPLDCRQLRIRQKVVVFVAPND